MSTISPQNNVLSSIKISDDIADSSDSTKSSPIVFSGFRKAIINVPAGSSITSISYYVADSEDGTYQQLYSGGSAVTTTVAHSKCYALDSAIEGAAFLKLIANAAGTAALHIIS